MKKVFVGSSKNAEGIAKQVSDILKDLGADTMCWTDPEAFPAAHNTLDFLIEAAHEHNAGVFIFNKDDQLIDPKNKSNLQFITRGNVIAEAGMFAGVLGKESVVLCTVPGVLEISDFKGITTLDLSDLNRLRIKLQYWLEHDVKECRESVEEGNILMMPRSEVHKKQTLDSRLHISDGIYKQIRHIRVMNFASNLIINPEVGEKGHIPHGDICLSDAMVKIMRETEARVSIILTEPNTYNLRDLETKIANTYTGSSQGCLYSALATLYKNLSANTIYRELNTPPTQRFSFHVMKTSMPFGVFNLEFFDEAAKFNHVKVDLYSASLDNEDQRRSFIVWQKDDPLNYQFFVDNFNNIRSNRQLSYAPTLNQLKQWDKKWQCLLSKGQ